MITYFQAVILGFLQGISELFPVSSLGHSVILPQLLRWNVNQKDPFFLTFLVATHLATSVVLFLFFWKDWVGIAKGMLRSFMRREIGHQDHYAKLGWLLVVGTIPAGILGLLFKEKLAVLFSSARITALFLIANGVLLQGTEILRRHAPEQSDEGNSDRRIARLTWWQAVKVGVSQIIALIPGFSRSGATMAGSLLVGLSHEDAVRFSFLLATPIIGAAAVLQIPDFFVSQNHAVIGPSVVGALCAAVSAYCAVRFLIRFFHTNKLTPFAVYCALAGLASLAALTLK